MLIDEAHARQVAARPKKMPESRRSLRSAMQGRFATDPTGLKFANKCLPIRLKGFSTDEELKVVADECPNIKDHLLPIFGGRLFNSMIQVKSANRASDAPCALSQVVFKKWVPLMVQCVISAYVDRIANASAQAGIPLLIGQIGMLLHPAGSKPQVLLSYNHV
jgi:hypothetical protein